MHRNFIGHWARSWKLCRTINSFEVWRIYRSWIVIGFFLVSLLCILFSGAFDIHQADEAAHGLRRQVLENLAAATLLMGIHAVYLGLMVYHLIFRHPVEEEEWPGGIAFLFIGLGYITHAAHDYHAGMESEHVSNWSLLLVSTPFYFSLAYLLMAAHGWLAWLKHNSSGHPERPALKAREKWIRNIDLVMLGLMVTALVTELRHPAAVPPSHTTEAKQTAVHVWDEVWILRVVKRAYDHSSPKDQVIFIALILYAVTRALARGKADPEELRKKMLKHHVLDGIPRLAELKTYLEGKLASESVWMDFKRGYGKQLHELLERLDLAPTLATTLRIEMPEDKKAAANDQAREQLRPFTLKFRQLPRGIHARAVAQTFKDSDVLHIANYAYQPSAVRTVLFLLDEAKTGAVLLLRFTAGASYYRAVSASMSCAPIGPYIHHATHYFLLADIARTRRWRRVFSEPLTLTRHCKDIDKEKTRYNITNWVESQYGEFAGDVIDRYIKAYQEAGAVQLRNWDFLYVFEKIA
jgi:putative Ca2+/H+ antiporter (TMEM165/GDT1 family)